MRARADVVTLFTTRIVRLFAYGFLSVVLALYLAGIGFRDVQIGLLFTLTLVGDAVISLGITLTADRIGRRRMLLISALLMVGAGAVFAFTHNTLLLMLAAIVGVVSPSGNEIGPFLPIEQAALMQLLPDDRRTHAFAWYNLAGSLATACGALAAGGLAHSLQAAGMQPLSSYRIIILIYAGSGILLFLAFLNLTPRVEIPGKGDRHSRVPVPHVFGLHESGKVIVKLSSLFAIDAFAGGFVIQSLVAYWFHIRFNLDVGVIGAIFFGANIFAAGSALFAVRIAAKIGLINTMVFTHMPSSVLLCLVPLMPTAPLAILVLLLRFSISQMDVPTRQSYVVAVVAPDERSAASGVTAIARSVGAALSPVIAGALLANPLLIGAPFVIAGGLKICYDLLLYRSFRAIRPPGEQKITAEQGR